jgi:serine/threonine protein kinase
MRASRLASLSAVTASTSAMVLPEAATSLPNLVSFCVALSPRKKNSKGWIVSPAPNKKASKSKSAKASSSFDALWAGNFTSLRDKNIEAYTLTLGTHPSIRSLAENQYLKKHFKAWLDSEEMEPASSHSASQPVVRKKKVLKTALRYQNEEKLSISLACKGVTESSDHPGLKRIERRKVLHVMLQSPFAAALVSVLSTTSPSVANELYLPGKSEFGVSDQIVSSLVYERVLGNGSYKTVYLVSGGDGSTCYALAVEPLRAKSDVKEALRGIRIAEHLESEMEGEDKKYVERIEGWWFQSSKLPEFTKHAAVIPSVKEMERRTRKPPSQFLGTEWLVALKPVYDMDLRTFARKHPILYHIRDEGIGDEVGSSLEESVTAELPLTENSALNLALELCRAGRLIHSTGLVHRDIKPKNIMLSKGHPVIIDFGFARFGNQDNTEGRLCIVEQGRVKGEVQYVLAPDVAMYRGCQDGDLYAMGKTLYETLFGEAKGSEGSGKQKITESEALLQNAKFRSIIEKNESVTESRFRMTGETRDLLLDVTRGMCRQDMPVSFEESEKLLMGKMSKMLC